MGINQTIRVPIFYGENLAEWISWMEKYFSDDGFLEEEKLNFGSAFIEGDARTWFDWHDSRVPFTSWDALKAGLFRRFGNDDDKYLEGLEQIWRKLEQLCLSLSKDPVPKPVTSVEDLKEETGEGVFNDGERVMSKESHTLKGKEKKNRTEVAYEVFDQMPVKESGETEKKMTDDERAEAQILEGKKKTDDERAEVVCKVFDKMILGENKAVRKKRKRKFTKAKRCKYKYGKVDSHTLQVQKTSKPRPLDNIKMTAYTHQVFNKQHMLRISKNKKKQIRLVEHGIKGISVHRLMDAKWLTEKRKRMKKLAKWEKHKFKQKPNKQKKIKGNLWANKNAFPWNSEIERKLITKNFGRGSKDKPGYDSVCLRFKLTSICLLTQLRWLLRVTQRRKKRKRQNKYMESHERIRERLLVVEMELKFEQVTHKENEDKYHIEESKGTLQFASRAKHITNGAQVNEILTDAALLKRQKLEIEELCMKLQGSQAEVLEQEILKLSNQMLKYELECERLKTQLEEERRKQKAQEQCIREQQLKIENFERSRSEDFTSLRKTPNGLGNVNDSSDVLGNPGFKSASHSFVVARSNYSELSDFSPMVDFLEDMLKRSFAEFHAQKKLPEKQQLLMLKRARSTKTIECIKGEPVIEDYYEMPREANECNSRMSEAVMQSPYAQNFLVSGRVVVMKLETGIDNLLGVVPKGPSITYRQYVVLVIKSERLCDNFEMVAWDICLRSIFELNEKGCLNPGYGEGDDLLVNADERTRLKIRLVAVSRRRDIRFTWMSFLGGNLISCTKIDKEKNSMAWKGCSSKGQHGEIIMMLLVEDVTPKQIILLLSLVSWLTVKNIRDVIEIFEPKTLEIWVKEKLFKNYGQQSEAWHGYLLVKFRAGASRIEIRRQPRVFMQGLQTIMLQQAEIKEVMALLILQRSYLFNSSRSLVDTGLILILHLEDKVNFGRPGIDRSSNLGESN